jgi:hypothetical protein
MFVGGAGFAGFFAVAIFVSLLLGFIPAFIASRKGYSFVLFWVFSLFWFFPALIVALLIQDRSSSGSGGAYGSPLGGMLGGPARGPCRRCGESVPVAAAVCRFCGQDYPVQYAATAPPPYR